jgi:hypothetical protein
MSELKKHSRYQVNADHLRIARMQSQLDAMICRNSADRKLAKFRVITAGTKGGRVEKFIFNATASAV